MDKALVVLSGGQDSTTCLYWAIHNGFKDIHAITFDYGQRHRLEIEAAKKIVVMANNYAKVTHEIIPVPNCLRSMSPLTSNNDLERYDNAEQMEKVIGNRRELTFVPMRNALFLTIAANRAEALGSTAIITGVCQMDNANYDDCREVFINATQHYINTALGHDHRGTPPIHIETPLMFLDKAATCKLAFNLPGCWDALAYSHTSYDGCYPPTDMNHANVLRADGFEKAGLPDPLVLRAWKEGLMQLPASSNYDPYRSTLASAYTR
jgi:7-cyano-7-deazaguanine synthase